MSPADPWDCSPLLTFVTHTILLLRVSPSLTVTWDKEQNRLHTQALFPSECIGSKG